MVRRGLYADPQNLLSSLPRLAEDIAQRVASIHQTAGEDFNFWTLQVSFLNLALTCLNFQLMVSKTMNWFLLHQRKGSGELAQEYQIADVL